MAREIPSKVFAARFLKNMNAQKQAVSRAEYPDVYTIDWIFISVRPKSHQKWPELHLTACQNSRLRRECKICRCNFAI